MTSDDPPMNASEGSKPKAGMNQESTEEMTIDSDVAIP